MSTSELVVEVSKVVYEATLRLEGVEVSELIMSMYAPLDEVAMKLGSWICCISVDIGSSTETTP